MRRYLIPPWAVTGCGGAQATAPATLQNPTRPTWLFSSGPIGDHEVDVAKSDPVDLPELERLARPRGHRVFWGAFDKQSVDTADLNPVFKFAARTFIPEGDWRDWPAIDAWAEEIAIGLTPSMVA